MNSQHLMNHAGNTASAATRALALVVGSEEYRPAMLRAIAAEDFNRLLGSYFPGSGTRWNELAKGCTALRDDEFMDVLELLREFRADDSDETAWLSSAVAAACLGNNHLWQDLGLADRRELSELLQTHFPQLFAKNTGNMKWKNFFYKQLCERAEVSACRAPSCAACADYSGCFGAE